MAEVDFERRLERLFAEGPDLPDAGAFADRIERRLNRGWNSWDRKPRYCTATRWPTKPRCWPHCRQ